MTLDSLTLARELEIAGFPPKQAQDTAAAVARFSAGTDTATKADVGALQAQLSHLAAKADLAAVQAQMSHLATKADLERSKGEILRWVNPLILGQFAATVALLLRSG